MKYTNDQYIQIIDNLISTYTEYPSNDFTGGSVGVTLINNCTQLKYKFTMYFGFKNKNAISKVIEVDKNIYEVLIKALEIKTLSNIDNSSKLSLDSINDILNIGSKVEGTIEGKPDTKTNTTTKTINTNTIITNTIVNFLNEKANTKFKPSSKKTQELINTRLNDGFVLEDFEKVINNKCTAWLNDSKMSAYLRPETLFSNKFEGYLNENANIAPQQSTTQQTINRVLGNMNNQEQCDYEQ